MSENHALKKLIEASERSGEISLDDAFADEPNAETRAALMESQLDIDAGRVEPYRLDDDPK